MKGIIKLNKKLNKVGKKHCSSCNNDLVLSYFSGNSSSCKDCKNKRVRELKAANPYYKEERRQQNIKYAKEQGLLYYARRNITSWKVASRKKNIPFNLTVDYVMDLWDKQGGRCYYTGKNLSFTLPSTTIGFPKSDAPSLDRLIPEKGYVTGNVAWCVWWVNRMKYEMDKDEFLDKIRLIIRCRDEQS